MKSLRLNAFAPPAESVELAEVDAPRPGPGQVLVAVEAAAINPSDFLIINGRYGTLPALPARLGAEGVGVVIGVGDDVDLGRIGERVLLASSALIGTWSEQAVVDAAAAVPLDGAPDPVQLAMLGINPATAYGLLHDFVTLRPGDWVVQTGGNSAISRTVTALATHYGFRTLSLVRRPAAAEEIADLGAAVVTDEHLAENLQKALAGDQAALLLDPIGGPLPAAAANAVRPGGTVVNYGAMSGEPTVLPPGQLVFRKLVLHGFWLNHWRAETPAADIARVYRELAELVDEGVLSVPVEATYPITEFRAALTHAQRSGRTGKVLFRF